MRQTITGHLQFNNVEYQHAAILSLPKLVNAAGGVQINSAPGSISGYSYSNAAGLSLLEINLPALKTCSTFWLAAGRPFAARELGVVALARTD